MKKLSILLAFLFCSSVFANGIDDKCPKFVVHGAPVSSITTNDQYLCKTNYAIHYRNDVKGPEYVVEHLTLESIKGTAGRKDDFRVDPEVPKQFQAQLSDYTKTGYDRGHLAPAADNSQSPEIMSESFFLSNMMPQAPNLNRGVWKNLETLIRTWASDKDYDIYVITGTIFDAGYKTIGENKVGVPTRTFKVIINNKNWKMIGFMFPNNIGTTIGALDYAKYAVSIYDIELATGIDFSPKLPKSDTNETKKPELTYWKGL